MSKLELPIAMEQLLLFHGVPSTIGNFSKKTKAKRIMETKGLLKQNHTPMVQYIDGVMILKVY